MTPLKRNILRALTWDGKRYTLKIGPEGITISRWYKRKKLFLGWGELLPVIEREDVSVADTESSIYTSTKTLADPSAFSASPQRATSGQLPTSS